MPRQGSKPYDQGYYREIYKILLDPILQSKPPHIHPEDWFAWAFSVRDRMIERWSVREDFSMPGHFSRYYSREDALKPDGHRSIKKGMEIWTRRDTLRPMRVELEVIEKSELFFLSPNQFKMVRPHLLVCPFREWNLRHPSYYYLKPKLSRPD